jgi:SAM-dependent methyltransferase
MPDREWWAALWPHPEDVLRAVGIRPFMTVLDLCCGDGYFTAALAKLVGGRVIALDIDREMLEQAEAEVARADATVLRWICADAAALTSHITEPVDFVLMANTFHGVPDPTGFAYGKDCASAAGSVCRHQLACGGKGTDSRARRATRTRDRDAHVAEHGSQGDARGRF